MIEESQAECYTMHSRRVRCTPQ